MATDASSYLFAPAHSWAISYQFLSLYLFHSQLSLMAYSPQSSIHFTKLNISNQFFFSSLLRSVPLTAFLLIYSYSTLTLENSLTKLVHHIQDENLSDLNTTMIIKEHHLGSGRSLFSAKFYIILIA